MIYLQFLDQLYKIMSKPGIEGDYGDLNAGEIEEARLYIEGQLRAKELVCLPRIM